MITLKEVENIAKLARLGITKAEIAKLQKDLSLVLGYAEKLKKVDVSGVEPTSHPLKIENVVRADEARSESQKLLSGFLKVRSIF
ncbi:MAG: Asp-tRNA(Asn)/Glu-tRNA(Gln) amidotransferase subunit GatC [Candidatus Nealsonbacteria bacterium]|nr:Asp-tRNA(Asn)/Glu-tRNA(Gln) amidotransferase subunit GatC [Candidatus Nealsonbacteria bacterium]